MKITRRELAGLAAAAVASAQVRGTESAEDLFRTVAEETRRSSAAIAEYEVPAATEPAFSFRA